MKLKGVYVDTRKVTFPHKAVKSHEHIVWQPGPAGVKTMMVRCDGTVTGAQG